MSYFFFFLEQDHYCDGSVILCVFLFFHIYKSSIAKETSYLSFELIRLDPGCGVAVLSSGDYYYYCTFCYLGPVHVLLADPRSEKLCKKKHVKICKGVSNLKARLNYSCHHARRCKQLIFCFPAQTT